MRSAGPADDGCECGPRTSGGRGAEDGARSAERGRGAEDVARSAERGAEDVARSADRGRGAEDVARSAGRGAEDVARSAERGRGAATRRTGRRFGLAGLALILAFGTGCRKREPTKVEVFDEAATPAQTEALGSLAPPWRAPERVVLANGLLVHWLHEEGTPTVHVRLLLPTHGLKAGLQGAPALVAARGLALELEAMGPRLAVRAELRTGIDRFEVALHGVAQETVPLLAGLADALAADPTRALAAGRRALAAELRPIDAEAQAASELVATLTGTATERERVDRAAVTDATDKQLLDAWKALTDPRQALLIVHAPGKLADEAMAAATADVAERWRQRVSLLGGNDAGAEPQALVRLRREKPPGRTGKHVTKPPLAPLRQVEPAGRGRGQLVLGRTIPTATARERSLARLTQRRLQEQIDARLVVSGSWAIFTVHIPLEAAGKPKQIVDPLEGTDPPKDAAAEVAPEDPITRRLRRELTSIRDRLRERPLSQDLFQAAQMWLGARMVAASVNGEDWTALWSESLDLAGADGEIAAALARDAQAMLAATPEEAVAWQQRWLDFNASEPGWAWVLVGAEAEVKGVVAFLKGGLTFDPPPAG
jgi:hypothetical protein